MSNSRYEHITIKVEDVKKTAIPLLYSDRTVQLLGAPGIGKTEICLQIAEELGFDKQHTIVFNPRTRQLADLFIPAPPRKLECGRWVMPMATTDIFPYDDKPLFVVIDELNNALQMDEATWNSVVLDKIIGPYRLPEGSMVMATGNRPGVDDCVSNEQTSVMKTRMSHLNVETTIDGFCNWGQDNNVIADILSFVQIEPLSILDGIDVDDPSGGCCPRNLTALSKSMSYGLYEKTLPQSIKGTIGKIYGEKLITHIKNVRENLNIIEIINNPLKCKLPDQSRPDLQYSVVYGLCSLVDKKLLSNLQDIIVHRDEISSSMKSLMSQKILEKFPNEWTSHSEFSNFILKNSQKFVGV